MSEKSAEHGFCDVCHVAYVPGYAGPCQEPRPPYDGSATCHGTVTLDEAVRMQRERADAAEAKLSALRAEVATEIANALKRRAQPEGARPFYAGYEMAADFIVERFVSVRPDNEEAK